MGKKLRFLIFVLLVLLVVFQKPLNAHTSALMLLSQEFPQIRIKPLHSLVRPPKHKVFEFKNLNDSGVVADIFYPSANSGQVPAKTFPAVILAMGVKTADKDKPVILGFADTLARLGYIVIWPRLEILDRGLSSLEEPETFISSYQYLEKDKKVAKNRISLVGFSGGASIALVAAESPLISEKLNNLVFFGGYYDIFDYLTSLETKSSSFESQKIPWEPAEGTVNHIREILAYRGIDSKRDKFLLEKVNPSKDINNFRAKIFILHEKSDSYVPYFESEKLNRALERKVEKTYLLVNLFEHVQVGKGKISGEMLGELLKLYLFTVKAFENL